MHRKSVAIAIVMLYITILAISAIVLPDLTVTGIVAGAPSFISPSEANLPLTVTIMMK